MNGGTSYLIVLIIIQYIDAVTLTYVLNIVQKKGIITSTCKRIGLIFRNPLYILIIIGYIFYTAITGAFSYWAPVFLSDTFGKDIFESDLIMGGITVGTGIIGTILGGFLLDISRNTITNVNKVSCQSIIMR